MEPTFPSFLAVISTIILGFKTVSVYIFMVDAIVVN